MKGTVIAVLVGILLLLSAPFHPDLKGEANSGEVQEGYTERVESLVREFLGAPYREGPLGEGEGERIYREDVFDCTTFVLTIAARMNAQGTSPCEAMREVHYYPPGEVSYRNRLHFSSYRNTISPYFQDITREVGGGAVKKAEVLLNRDHPRRGRLIDLDWERKVTVEYIPSNKISEIVENLPAVAGAGFVRREYFSLGLGVAHEGIVLNGTDLAHASSAKGKVVREDFLGYLQRHEYTGVLFFRIETP